jgi:hypothetical protein
MIRRAEILAKLARFDEPSAPLMAELRTMGWDWDGEPLLVLTTEHLLSIMDRFLSGQLSAHQVAEWAGNLEVRDDVAFDPARADLLDEVFFCLASPEINYGISNDSIERLRLQLVGG